MGMNNTKMESRSREDLERLVQRAEALLVQHRGLATDGSLDALRDMLEQAQKALKCNGEVTFTRNREFTVPRTEEAICFAARRYTMVPPFKERGAVFTYYGLESALEWFEEQDIMGLDADGLADKAALALHQAKELLQQAGTGAGVGKYVSSAKEALQQATSMLEMESRSFHHSSDKKAATRSIVAVYNRMRELRHSRQLLTDHDPLASLYFTGTELEKLRHAVHTDPLIRKRYAQIEQLSEAWSLDDLKHITHLIMEGKGSYDELNRRFYLWSSTDKIVNFRVPPGAKTATLSFILPSEENEEEGLGHIWIDDLDILSAKGGSVEIVNGGFEKGEDGPLGWRPVKRQGSPILHRDEAYPFCGGGHSRETVNVSSQAARRPVEGAACSLYICNPGPADEGAWTCDSVLKVEEGADYTLTFAAKLDGKMKHGLRVLISFLDEQGGAAGEFDYRFNRKSSLPGGQLQLGMQCDAIRFAISGELEYAEKTKLAILYILNDFCQGAEHWMVTNLRPEGSDSYGAVQGGRLLCAVAVSCSLIRTSNVFNVEERNQFYNLAEYMLRYLLDLRDRTEWLQEEAQSGCSNWQTDMCAGVGYLMMALPDFPNRHSWLNNANAVLLAQLQLKVNPDGSWPESIRYHHAALERFAGYAKVLKKVTGENWFETTPLADMFRYVIEMQTPGYEYFGGRIGTPPFGDHALGGGEEFGYFPTFIPEIAEHNPQLADRMHAVWVAAGAPAKKLWGESVLLENLLVPANSSTQVTSTLPLLESTDDYPDAGIYIFRNEGGDASYFAIMSSPRPIAHGHLDQGSFILYAGSVPLVMDSGIEGYFDGSTSWHICSYSHACVQFASGQNYIPSTQPQPINLTAGTFSLERGWLDVPRTSRVLEVNLGKELESIVIEIASPAGTGRHIRSVVHVKEPDLYLIWDEIKEYTGKVLFTLPVAALQTAVDDSFIQAECAYGMALDTVFLSTVHSIDIDRGRSTAFFPGEEPGASYMHYIRAVADAGDGFLTVLRPRRSGEPMLAVIRQPDGTAGVDTGQGIVRIDIAALKRKESWIPEKLTMRDAISVSRS